MSVKYETAVKLGKALEKGQPEEVFVEVDETHITFHSWYTGAHSMSLSDSNRARILNHWKGFLGNQPKGEEYWTY